MFLKNCQFESFKTDFSHILRVSDLQATCELLTKCANAQGKFSQARFESQSTREWVAKIYAWICEEIEISSNLFTTWMGVHPLAKWIAKLPKNKFFYTKILRFWEKLLKQKWQKSLPKTNKTLKKIFLGLINKQLSIHTSHLNMYNHTNEIDIYWILDLCVVCENQV